MNLKEAIETKARLTLIKSVCSLLEKNPDKNIPNWLSHLLKMS